MKTDTTAIRVVVHASLKLVHRYAFGTVLLMVSLVAISDISNAQESTEDSLYWKRDTLLQQALDTLGRDAVISEVRAALQHTKKWFGKHDASLPADSIDSWVQAIRWAVILRDPKSLTTLSSLVPLVQSDSRGDGQYYFAAMVIWGDYEAKAANSTTTENTRFLLDQLDQGTPLERTVYREQLIALGPSVIPEVLSWARKHIVPRLAELDKEKLSEADLEFPRYYDEFILLVANLTALHHASDVLSAYMLDSDPGVQRIIDDVLVALR